MSGLIAFGEFNPILQGHPTLCGIIISQMAGVYSTHPSINATPFQDPLLIDVGGI
jgi:hypothetical protein